MSVSKGAKIKSIRMINFGPFKDKTVEFGPNVNYISAPNNRGKSFTVSAIEILLKNIADLHVKKNIKRKSGNMFTIIGEWYTDDMSFTIQLDRGPSLGRYSVSVNGGEPEVITCGAKVPDTVYRLAHYCDNGIFNLNIRRDDKALVDSKGSENYKTIRAALKTGEVHEAINAIKVDMRALKEAYEDTKEKIASEIVAESYKGFISSYESLALVVQAYNKTVDIYDLLVKCDDCVQRIRADVDINFIEKEFNGIEELSKQISLLNNILTNFDEFTKNKEINIDEVTDAYSELTEIENVIAELYKYITISDRFIVEPDVDFEGLAKLVVEIKKTEREIDLTKTVISAYDRLDKHPDVDISEVLSAFDEIRQDEERIRLITQYIKSSAYIIPEISIPDFSDEFTELRKFSDAIELLKSTIASAEKSVASSEDVKKLNLELTSLYKDAGTCEVAMSNGGICPVYNKKTAE